MIEVISNTTILVAIIIEVVERRKKRRTTTTGTEDRRRRLLLLRPTVVGVVTATSTTATATIGTIVATRESSAITEGERGIETIEIIGTLTEEEEEDGRGDEKTTTRMTTTTTTRDQSLAFQRRWKSFTKRNCRTARRRANEVLIDHRYRRRCRTVTKGEDDNTGETSKGTRKID
jgi:hypothetical protein